MKLIYKATDRIAFELEVESQVKSFHTLAAIAEVFPDDECGKCKGRDLVCAKFTSKGRTFFKHRCKACGAELFMAEHEGRLFASRKDRDGNVLADGGWSVYQNGQTQNRSAESNGTSSGGAKPNEEIPFAYFDRQAVLQVLGDETPHRVLSAPSNGRWAARQVQGLRQS